MTIGDHAAAYIRGNDEIGDHVAYGWPDQLHEIARAAGIIERMDAAGKCDRPGWQMDMMQRVLDGIERDRKRNPGRWERFEFRCFVGYTPTGGDLQRNVRAYRLLEYEGAEQ